MIAVARWHGGPKLVVMPRWVPILLFVGLLGIAFGAPLARFLPAMPAVAIAFWRMATAAGMLWGYSAIARPGPLPIRQRRWTLVAGILLALHFAFFYAAVKRAPIANATLFATLAPLFTLIIERFFQKRHMPAIVLVGLAVAVVGMLIVQGPNLDLQGESTGNLLALVSSIFMAGVLLVAEGVRREADNVVYTRWLYLAAAGILGIIALVQNIDLRFTAADIPWILALGFLPTILGHNSLSFSVKYLRPTIVGSMPLGEPILATILAWFFFQEPFAFRVALGGLVTLSGLLVITLKRRAGVQRGSR